MPSHDKPRSPAVEMSAIALALLALASLGWKATYAMGRNDGSGFDTSWSFLLWTVIGLFVVGLLFAGFLVRRRGPGTSNRTAALVTIAISLVVLVLMVVSSR